MSSSIQEIVSQFRNSVGGRSQEDGMVGDAFSQLFNSRLNRQSQSQSSVMDRFAQLFPSIPASIGTVPDGLEAAKAYFARDKGDQLTVSPDAADKMEKDSSFASTVQEAVQAMLNGGSPMMGSLPAGLTSQVGITVTTITIRYTEIHYNTQGQAEAGVDLVSEFKDRLKEMLEAMFGKPVENEDEEETVDAADTDADPVKAADVREMKSSSYQVVGWSMQVMYSQSMLQMTGQQTQTGANAMFGMSMSGAATGSWAVSGGFSMGGVFPNFNVPNMFSSPFFANMNIANERMSNNELFFNLGSGKSALSDLWNALTNSSSNADVNAAEPPAESEALEDSSAAPAA